MRTLPQGDRFPSEIYRIDPKTVPSMGGTDLLDHVLKSRGTRLAAVSGEECFASRFCVDAAFIGTPHSVMDPRICDVVGSRCVTDVFDRFPVQEAATECPVDHLGCRYFQFGTSLAFMRLLREFQLIGESPSTSEWLRRSVVFQSAQQRTLRHAKSRECLTFW